MYLASLSQFSISENGITIFQNHLFLRQKSTLILIFLLYTYSSSIIKSCFISDLSKICPPFTMSTPNVLTQIIAIPSLNSAMILSSFAIAHLSFFHWSQSAFNTISPISLPCCPCTTLACLSGEKYFPARTFQPIQTFSESWVNVISLLLVFLICKVGCNNRLK